MVVSCLDVPNTWIPVKSEELLQLLHGKICQLWEIAPKHEKKNYATTKNQLPLFPGSNPISLMKDNLGDLCIRQNEYVVAEKTDGNRFFMCFLFLEMGGVMQKFQVFVNRKYDIYVGPFEGSIEMHNGTIVDGELVRKTNSEDYIFLCFDTIAYNNEKKSHLPYTARLRIAQTCIKDISVNNKLSVSQQRNVSVELKQIYTLSQIASLVNITIKKQPYPNDGLIFTPKQKELVPYRNTSQYKWKSSDKHYIDFAIMPSQNRHYLDACSNISLDLFSISKGKLILFLSNLVIPVSHLLNIGIRDLRDLPTTHEVIQEFPEKRIIVEWSHNPFSTKYGWFPVRRRFDKSYPNDEQTVKLTIQNIIENITLSELIEEMSANSKK